jgi:hypothetical protein
MISRFLNDENYKTSYGNDFTKQTVKKLIDNYLIFKNCYLIIKKCYPIIKTVTL